MEIHCPANLAIPGMLREEYGLTFTRNLEKERKARLELVLPIHFEAKAIDVKSQAALGIGDSELGDDGLLHEMHP